jgi:hypothetical protein
MESKEKELKEKEKAGKKNKETGKEAEKKDPKPKGCC